MLQFPYAVQDLYRQCCFEIEKMGVKKVEDTVYSLLFADDGVVLTEDKEDANYTFRKLVEEYNKLGLEINLQKTQYMVIEAQCDLHIENGIIKRTDQYQ